MSGRGDDAAIPVSPEYTEPDMIGSRKAPGEPHAERATAARLTAIRLLLALTAVLVGWHVMNRGLGDVGTPASAGGRPPSLLVDPQPAVSDWRARCARASGAGNQLPPPDAAARCLAWVRGGDYSSSVLGLNYRRPFNFTLPDGWTVTRGLGEVEVRSGDAGLTLFVYPAPTSRPQVRDTPLWRWLHARKWLHLSDERSAFLGGIPGRQLDIRPLANAPLQKSGCRLQTPCVPLLTGTVAGVRGFAPTVTVELHPGVTSRLWLGAALGVPPAVLIWNAVDADEYRDSTDTQVLLRSLQLGEGVEQGQPARHRG